ncbi:MAG: hypothetical protein GY757_49275, partial [bacterium]|nr:hypothetical protein [bacterium]
MSKTILTSIILTIFIMIPTLLIPIQEAETEDGGDYIEEYGDDAVLNWTTKVLRVKGDGFGPEKTKEPGRR